jgi:hypothetical protein
MTDRPVLETPMDRRRFLRGAAAGLTVAGGGLLVASRTARAATAASYSLQPNWGFCSLCFQAYYGGSPFRGRGVCPRQPGDGHATPSSNYSMPYNESGAGYQAGWRWCQYCYSLYWPGSNAGGQCVAERGNGSHSPGASFSYAVPIGLPGSAYQHGWVWCAACSTLYHSNGGWGTDAGFCWVNSNRFGGKTSHSHGSATAYELII